ncbi:hypothetical protein [Nostoc sp. FACHB-280]|uniref:hypothetical protein n=1 Tax=Nostoc sp. FACHB-280 TaxID=2692839 RepID=UPI00168B5B9A|nr:hypothetical protein [Nostoc sp. FACHB-280]MBD2498353.1 hypothetical protein [Nostoc sp. FACHB-280]
MLPEKKFRVVNQSLGTQPKIGPLPAEQIFPWLVITMGCIFGFYYMLNWGWLATLFASLWGCATWWFVSSNKSFLGKFVGTPRISRGYMQFISLINDSVQPKQRNNQKKVKRTKKIKKIN